MTAAEAITVPGGATRTVEDGLIIDLRHPEDTAGSGRRGIPFFAGLDGLRGVAVIAVLCFHGGFAWATGGYLGVSTFFTLSGFLITSLLLAEARTERHIDLKGFYGRRLRRLMPASLAAIALAVTYAVVAGSATQQRNLGGDVTASLLDVANWHFIVQQVSYGDLFSAPSPLLHFWSLAIEEQFYLLFPLIVMGAAVGWRRRRPGRHHRDASPRPGRVIALVAALMAASLAITLFAGYSHDRIYFGTETRGFELLAGALMAAIVARGRLLDRPWSRRSTEIAASVGAIAAAICVGLWVTVSQDSDWLYRGGLAAYAVVSCAVIAAVVAGHGPLHAVLASRPLRRVGELSYGIYVYHWPIFLYLDEARTGLSIWPLFAVRIAVTVALAVASARFLELPIRRRRLTFAGRGPAGGRVLAMGAAVVAVVLLAGAWTVTRDAAPPVIDFNAIADQVAQAEEVPPPAPAAAEVLRPARVAVFGDSTAATVAGGLAMTNAEQQLVTEVRGKAKLGCPLGRGGQIRSKSEHLQTKVSADCSDWAEQFGAEIDSHHPDIAVVLYGPWDVLDRKLPHDSTWRGFGDPTYDAFMRSELLAAVDVLSSRGALVVWFTTPPVRDDQARTDRFNELIRELPAERPGKVVTLDLAGWVASTGDSVELRPDHLHITPVAAAGMSRDWLIPQLRWLWVARVGQDPTRVALDPSVDPAVDHGDDLSKPD